MNLSTFTTKLKTHIQQNQIKEVFEVLGTVLLQANSYFENELYLLSNRYHQHQAKVRSGLIDEATSRLTSNQLNYALLSLIDELPSDEGVRQYFNGVEAETLHRGPDPVHDLLETTLHRHQQAPFREWKQWHCVDPYAQRIIVISTADVHPQGAFYQKDHSISFGRALNCDIVIYNPYMSRKHAEIRFDKKGSPVIEDCNSKNGSLMNDRRIDGVQPLEEGNLRLDTTDFEIRFK